MTQAHTDEQLEFYCRKAQQAIARTLRDFKARKPDIAGELRALVMEGALGNPGADDEMTHCNLDRLELEGLAQAVAATLAKMYRGWPK
ncbi:MAG: hypothetical protein JXA57_17725 [Armatimonadetes bacterium]|nr:hypothetical protein [Armatimonadota bacterium]